MHHWQGLETCRTHPPPLPDLSSPFVFIPESFTLHLCPSGDSPILIPKAPLLETMKRAMAKRVRKRQKNREPPPPQSKPR